MRTNRGLIYLAQFLLAGAMAAAPCFGASFGTAVAIGGHASDIALDEGRAVLYIANFTANRIEVMSTADNAVRTSMNLDHPLPGALALSPDGQFLVVAHFPPPQPANATGWLTVIDLNTNTRTGTAVNSPLGVAFTRDGRVVVVTTTGVDLLDPVSMSLQSVTSYAALAARALPAPLNTFPAEIVEAAVAVSRDGTQVCAFGSGANGHVLMRYETARNQVVQALSFTATPKLLPRVSLSDDGEYCAAGYAVFNRSGAMVAQFSDPVATLNTGTMALYSKTNTLYAHIPDAKTSTTSLPASSSGPAGPLGTSGLPVLTIMDADNMTVRERLLLPENLTGRAVLSEDGASLYSVSDSGVVALPVGKLNQYHRLSAGRDDAVVRATFCDRRVVTVELAVTDPGGGNTDFTVTSDVAGVTVSPTSGMTPATVRIRVDPNAFQNQNGSRAIPLTIRSIASVNVPRQIRLLVNNRNPDQRGTAVSVSGTLTDLLADPARDRFYIVRQDRNEVLVFDGTSYRQITSLRTAATPTRLALTFDRKYLLVGHDNSQLALVYDLDTLEQQIPITFPLGHYPRVLAASGKKLLAVGRGEAAASLTGGASAAIGSLATGIDSVDFAARRASTLPTLGIYTNQIQSGTVLAPSPNGNLVLGAMPDGNVFLYNASADTFTVSRKDSASLAGAYAASSYDYFFIGNVLLNASLVPVTTFDSSLGASSGFAFNGQQAFRTVAPTATAPGVIQRVEPGKDAGTRATRMVEAPLTGGAEQPFTRTLAPLSNGNNIVVLTTSGFTVLASTYDAAVAPPRIEKIVNAADQTQPVAPGGLISVFGSQMSLVNLSTRQIPLPTALGESCLTVNGVPVPIILVSNAQINGQLPFNVDGSATMTLRTPGGTSDNFYFTILPAAPRIFRNGTAGPETGLPAVTRALNGELVTLANPIHPKDTITIYATGLGRTMPAVESGEAAPADPLTSAVITPAVTLGGVPLELQYAGLVPGEVGVYQINAVVPGNVPTGMEIPLAVAQAGVATSLNVRVVK
jgi:uncharacterized protein (TIGR03437 family)